MRLLTIVLVLGLALPGFAKPRQWKDAVLIDISSGPAGTAVAPVGNMAIGIPVTQMFYWFASGGTIYILQFNPWNHFGGPPRFTMNAQTKIEIDGKNAHVLDAEGKDRKLPISQVIAKPANGWNCSQFPALCTD